MSTVTWWAGTLSQNLTQSIVTHLGCSLVGWGIKGVLLVWENYVLFENVTRDVQYSSVSTSPKVPLCALLHQRTQFITTLLLLGWDSPLLACLPLNLCLDFRVNCNCLLWLNLLCTDYHIHVKFSSFAYPPTDMWTKNTVNLPSQWNLKFVSSESGHSSCLELPSKLYLPSDMLRLLFSKALKELGTPIHYTSPRT